MFNMTIQPPKTYIFIDSANIIFGAKSTGRWKVDFKKLYDYLIQKYHAEKIFYYTGIHQGLPKDIFLIEDLEKIGYIVRNKELKFIRQHPLRFRVRCPKCNYSWNNKFSRPPVGKANCDVDLTLDVLKEISHFNRAIFMSGDGDFLPLYQYLESKGIVLGIISESKITAQVIKRHFKERFSDLLSIKKQIS